MGGYKIRREKMIYSEQDIIKLSDIIKENEQKIREKMKEKYYLHKILEKTKRKTRYSNDIVNQLCNTREYLNKLGANNTTTTRFRIKKQNGVDTDVSKIESIYGIYTGLKECDFYKIKKDGEIIFYNKNKYLKYKDSVYNKNEYTLYDSELYSKEQLKGKLYIGKTSDDEKIFLRQRSSIPWEKETPAPVYELIKEKLKPGSVEYEILTLFEKYKKTITKEIFKYKENVKILKRIKCNKKIFIPINYINISSSLYKYLGVLKFTEKKEIEEETKNKLNGCEFEINNLLEYVVLVSNIYNEGDFNKVLSNTYYLLKDKMEEKKNEKTK